MATLASAETFQTVLSDEKVSDSLQIFAELFPGLVTFAYSKPLTCFGLDAERNFDVAVLGAPFDTATTYRPGARFGPNGIRQGSRRVSVDDFNVPLDVRVSDHLDVADCGDVPMVTLDNKVALRQLESAVRTLMATELPPRDGQALAKDGRFHPRILALGGDHTITLPLLRNVAETYGPVSVIHFDSHIDTWRPGSIDHAPRLPGEKIPVNHGTYFWFAHEEGLLANNTNIASGFLPCQNYAYDLDNDRKCGFTIAYAEDIEDIGYKGIVKRIRDTVGNDPVYISIDIDVIDPGLAPGTGTPEIGGFTTREMKKILQGLDGLKIVGADIVEVAPVYDSQSEVTQIAAANIGWQILSLMAKTPLAI